MKQLLGIILCLLLGFGNLIAQTAEIKWGPPEDIKKASVLYFFKKEPLSLHTYWLETKHDQCFMVTLDENNNRLASKELLFPGIPLKDLEIFDIVSILSVSKKIVALASGWDKKQDVIRYYILNIAFDGTILKTDAKTIFEHPAEGGKLRVHETFRLSSDSSHCLVNLIFSSKTIKKNENVFRVFNSDVRQVYAKEYISPDEDECILPDNYIVFDNQRIYLLEQKRKNKESIGTGSAKRARYLYNLTILNTSLNTKTEYTLDSLSNKKIDDIALTVNKNGVVLVSGFYSDIDIYSLAYQGIFSGEIRNNGTPQLSFRDLPAVEKLNRSSPDKLLKSVQYIPKDDGGVLLISEQIIFDHNNKRAGNILIVSANKDATFNYCQTVLKSQVMLFQLGFVGYHSFFPLYQQQQKCLKLIYNDNPENLTLGSRPFVHQMRAKASIPVLVTIDSAGVLSRRPLISMTHSKVILCPLFSCIASPDELMVIGKEGHMIRNGTLKLMPLDCDTLSRMLAAQMLQKDTAHVSYKHIGIGIKTIGVCFGNSRKYSGIRLNAIDKKINNVNGLNVALVNSKAKRCDGVSLGLLVDMDTIQNGISFGTFANIGTVRNGIAASAFITVAKKTNGLAVAGITTGVNHVNGAAIGFATLTDTLRGFNLGLVVFSKHTSGIEISYMSVVDSLDGISLSIFGSGSSRLVKNSRVRGLIAAGFFVSVDKVEGVTISAINDEKELKGLAIGIYNHSKKLRGVQLGLLNYVGNNPKGLRLLPFINIHLRKDN